MSGSSGRCSCSSPEHATLPAPVLFQALRRQVFFETDLEFVLNLLRRLLLKPSTRAYYDQARARPDFSWAMWLHGYVYGRWPYLYIAAGTGSHPLTRLLKPLYGLFRSRREGAAQDAAAGKTAFAHGYHGKVVPLEQARKLVTVRKDIDLGDLEQVIPYAAAREIVLRNPDHITVLECPCRAARSSPCLPMDVCLIVGEPFAGFIAEHHPRRARRISQREAEEILAAEQRRGHVHHAFFKDAMLGRFYAICNCCACCCGAMQARRNGVPMLAPSGYVSSLAPELCKRCGLCVEHCQFAALSLEDGKVLLHADACMGCGVCAAICPAGAVTLVRDSAKGEPLDIHRLVQARAEA